MIRRLMAATAVQLALASTIASPAFAAAPDPDTRTGLAHARARDGEAARATLPRIDSQAERDLVMWHMIRAREATFTEAEDFLTRASDWPGIDLIRARAEAVMPATIEPARVIAFFSGEAPRTARGALMLAIALEAEGRTDEAQGTAIDAWLTMPMPASSQAGFEKVFGDLLAPYAAARLDAMAWSGDTESAARILPRVDGPEAALARARIALREGRPGVDGLIEAVPEAFRDHQGLAYERFRWRLDKGRRDDALELLFAYDDSADTLGSPEAWAPHRERLARGLMQDGRPEDGYRVAAMNHLPDGHADKAGNEWLAGYIALRFLDDADAAVAHFQSFDANVASPISKGRAGYWLGRALEAAGDNKAAQLAYAEGARYQTSFYGQLAAERAGLPADPLLDGSEAFAAIEDSPLAEDELFQASRALLDMGETDLARRFMAHMAEVRPRDQIGTLIDVALAEGEEHIALKIAKSAAEQGFELHAGYFPVTELAEMVSPVAPELSLSIARRESEFNPVVKSHAGAAGLMQLMPGTAREMAGRIGESYSPSKLTDPLFNARLGTTYLSELEAEFGLSPVLVPAAYNAGPSRARRWSAEMGHPSDAAIDIVDWIEDVPFSETRNYIMRVSESLLPYHARLNGTPEKVALTDWLRTGYHDLVPEETIKATRAAAN